MEIMIEQSRGYKNFLDTEARKAKNSKLVRIGARGLVVVLAAAAVYAGSRLYTNSRGGRNAEYTARVDQIEHMCQQASLESSPYFKQKIIDEAADLEVKLTSELTGLSVVDNRNVADKPLDSYLVGLLQRLKDNWVEYDAQTEHGIVTKNMRPTVYHESEDAPAVYLSISKPSIGKTKITLDK